MEYHTDKMNIQGKMMKFTWKMLKIIYFMQINDKKTREYIFQCKSQLFISTDDHGQHTNKVSHPA